MNSELSSDSETDSPIHPLYETAKELFPLIDGLSSDMGAITTKINQVSQSSGWLHTPIAPIGKSIKTLLANYKIPSGNTIHDLVGAVFLKAKSMDLASRTIHFSDDDAKVLGKSSMTLFEFLNFIISSVEFV